MARRGLELHAVHFFSYPYTSEEAKEKVLTLLRILSEWTGPITLHIAPFTDIQEEIRDHCPEELFTIIMRRFMMRVSQRIAQTVHFVCAHYGRKSGPGCEPDASCAWLRRTTSPLCRSSVRSLGWISPISLLLRAVSARLTPRSSPMRTAVRCSRRAIPFLKPRIDQVEQAERKLNLEELVEASVRGAERWTVRPDGASRTGRDVPMEGIR